MKTSKKIAPVLFLLALLAVFGFGFLWQGDKVMAEAAANTVEAASFQSSATRDDQSRKCEQREVEADEGYGVSRKEVRVICH